jgi:hypothetical protein
MSKNRVHVVFDDEGEEVRLIDNYQHAAKLETRSEAVVRLVNIALERAGPEVIAAHKEAMKIFKTFCDLDAAKLETQKPR